MVVLGGFHFFLTAGDDVSWASDVSTVESEDGVR